ncbi:RDD family protein [Smaragdicoccus niigatensis]|uniref:RDD family protein n=1 Tax=Smaragdicoccus niigatensis TaxID=359359 RepID=UPI00037EE984|nr:RDD family protein [Smaragdicoccus niigatensis]
MTNSAFDPNMTPPSGQSFGASYQPQWGAPGVQPGGNPPPPFYPGQSQNGFAPRPTPGAGQPAELLDRFLALLIDSVLLWVVSWIVIAIVGVVSFASGSFAVIAVITFIGWLVVIAAQAAYFVLLQHQRGQTFGMQIMKLKVEGPTGANPTLEQAAKRCFYVFLPLTYAVGGLIPLIGWLLSLVGAFALLAAYIYIAVTINQSPTRQGWHDHFAGGTRVVKTA